MTAQLAKIYLPLYMEPSSFTGQYPSPTPANTAHDYLRTALFHNFGSYVRTEGHMASLAGEDEVFIYEFPIRPVPASIQKLRDIATNAAQKAGRSFIDILLPSGIHEVLTA